MKRKRILSLLLALAVMATMLMAVPLTGYAATTTVNFTDTEVFDDGKTYSYDSTGSEYVTSNVLFTVYAGLNGSVIDSDYGIKYNGNTGTVKFDSTTVRPIVVVKTQSAGKLEVYFSKVGTAATESEEAQTKTVYVGSVDSISSTSGTSLDSGSSAGEAVTLTTTTTAGGYYLIGGGGTNAGLTTISFTPASPSLLLSDGSVAAADDIAVSMTAGSDTTLTASFSNTDEAEVTWTSSNDDVAVAADSDDSKTATVTVADTASVDDTATITATAETSDGTTLTATCTVRVVAPTADVVIRGSSTKTFTGIKKITLTNTETGDKYYAEWSKSDGTAIYSNNTYERKIENVPFGDYTVSIDEDDLVDMYYTVTEYTKSLTVDSTTTENVPNITVTATQITSTTEEIDYSYLKNNTVTYSFNTKDGSQNEYIAYENSGTEAPVYSDDYNKNVYMLVDTVTNRSSATIGSNTGGKFNSIAQGNTRIQVNLGTILKIPVVKGSTVSITSYNEAVTVKQYTENEDGSYTYGDEKQQSIYYNGSDGWLNVVVDTNGYLYTVTVTPPTYVGNTNWIVGSDDNASAVATTDPTGSGYSSVIDISGKNVYQILDSAVSSGKYYFSVDVYYDGSTGFRIYLENESAGTSQGTTGIIAQVVATDSGKLFAGAQASPAPAQNSGQEIVSAMENGWYNFLITLDYDEVDTTNFITVETTTPSGMVDTKTMKNYDTNAAALKQIRVISRGAAGSTDLYFANDQHGTYVFGDSETDSGYYTSGDQNVGVIRFLQEFIGDTTGVTGYGFYFIDSDGKISSYYVGKTTSEQSINGGFYGDLTGIEGYDTDATTYSAKPYVIIGSEADPFYGVTISGSVDWTTEVNDY